jgi:hypothetical protein
MWNGLACNHAYTVLTTYQVTSTDGVVTNLMLVRNPWGSDGAYNGTWRDRDPIWLTNGYTSQVPYRNNTGDGLFYISQDDYHATFNYMSVSYFMDDYVHSTSSVYNDTTGQNTIFEFTIAEDVEGFLGVDFYTPRMYPKGCKLTSTGSRQSSTASLTIIREGAELFTMSG